MFVFVFEGALFVFEYTKPAFAPLFALPPIRTPRREQSTCFVFSVIFFVLVN